MGSSIGYAGTASRVGGKGTWKVEEKTTRRAPPCAPYLSTAEGVAKAVAPYASWVPGELSPACPASVPL
eukprot:3100958-Rhodomonas_salina.3